MKLLLIMIGILLAIQLIRFEKINPPVDDTITLKAPQAVMDILKTSCYDCHSDETIWPFYAEIAPLSWNIIGHVNDGRKALNYSKWKEIEPEIKIERLKRSIKTINNNMMPLENYLLLHEEAKLTKEQKKIVIDWCNEELNKK